MLANDGDGLCGGNVVAGRPVIIRGTAVEIFFDELLSPRQSVAPAHEDTLWQIRCPQCGRIIIVRIVPHHSWLAAEEAQSSQPATTLFSALYGGDACLLSQAHEAQW